MSIKYYTDVLLNMNVEEEQQDIDIQEIKILDEWVTRRNGEVSIKCKMFKAEQQTIR